MSAGQIALPRTAKITIECEGDVIFQITATHALSPKDERERSIVAAVLLDAADLLNQDGHYAPLKPETK